MHANKTEALKIPYYSDIYIILSLSLFTLKDWCDFLLAHFTSYCCNFVDAII